MALSNQPLIEMEGVSFRYDSEQPDLLNQIHFELYSGEQVALTGINGSGKSTLLQLLMGLIWPTAGLIKIFGRVRREEKDFVKIRGAIGLLFQDAEDQLFCPTVAEDIAFGPLNQRKSVAQVQKIVQNTLNLLDLKDYADRITYQLSGGEKRLVALATVLAMQPTVLLLDEPTNGLDDHYRQRIIQILLQLPQAMLIVSHDKEFLEQVTQRKIFLTEGRLVSERDCSQYS